MFAYLFVGVHAVVEVGDERGDSALEVDIVFPQRIVCVEEEVLVTKFRVNVAHLAIICVGVVIFPGGGDAVSRGWNGWVVGS